MLTSGVHIIPSLSLIFESLIHISDEDWYNKVSIRELSILRELFFSQLYDDCLIAWCENRTKFSVFVLKKFTFLLPEDVKATKFFDSVYDSENQGHWVYWDMHVLPYLYPKDEAPEFLSILAPTVDKWYIQYLMDYYHKGEVHALFSEN
jgi:hypothetical protein